MTAYYNEIDPYAAQWLRNLIKAGLIAPGYVDERSIIDVKAEDLTEFTQCHFFAGIGVWSLALRNAGWEDDRPVWTGSCPCQPFSVAGNQLGQLDERHLAPVWINLIKERKPSILFGEQVAGAISKNWLDDLFNELEAESYACGAAVLPACCVGAPHIRQRITFGAKRVEHTTGAGRQQRGAESGRRGIISGRGANGVADTNGGSIDRSRCSGAGGRDEPPNSGIVIGLADGHSDRQQPGSEHGCSCQPFSQGDNTGRGCETCRLAYADSNEQQQGSIRETGATYVQRGQKQSPAEVTGLCLSCGLAYTNGEQSQRLGACNHPIGREKQNDRSTGLCHGAEVTPFPAAVNGFWRDADWLSCRDGKWRPVESSTFPLAHGVANRVGRLRAYGNSIVPQAAEAFIKAFESSLKEQQ